MEEIQMSPGMPAKKGISLAGLVILLVLGLLFVLLVGQKKHVVCTRVGDNVADCEIKTVWMESVTISSREASGVCNAYVDSNYDSEDNSTTYRVMLTAKDNDVPVSRAYSSGNTKKMELAKGINDFIKYSNDTELDLDYRSVGNIISTIIVGVFFAIFGIGVFFSRRR
jgi:hypothetical protein